MTVYELKMMLDNYDDDTEVMIGVYQTYGSDFAYNIDEIEEEKEFHGFYGERNKKIIFLLEGSQVGVMSDPDEDYDEDEDEDEY